VPPALGAVVRRALAYDPGGRYATCAELRDALERAMLVFLAGGTRPSATAVSLPPPRSPPPHRLLTRGYSFKESDVDADREARGVLRKAGGAVPALEIDGAMLPGFDAERIQAAIDHAGVTRVQKGL
jgi:hypothetical protein